jgi:hypothetical protein
MPAVVYLGEMGPEAKAAVPVLHALVEEQKQKAVATTGRVGYAPGYSPQYMVDQAQAALKMIEQ